MLKKPLVSVVTIFLNEERFLQEAIESVFAQTYPNWELLLVDDGSTDNSTQIACDYMRRYPQKVRYMEHAGHENRGMSASRNLALSHAKGEYISPLDGDDVWLANKLERQVAILQSHPKVEMVYGSVQKWYSWTGKIRDRFRDHLYGLHDSEHEIELNSPILPPKLLCRFLPHGHLIPLGILVKRKALEEVGGSEEIFRESSEDVVVLAKLLLRSTAIASDEWWYRYRMHSNSSESMVKKMGKVAECYLRFLKWFESYLLEQNIDDKDVWDAWQQAIWPFRHPRLNFLKKGCRLFIGLPKATMIYIGRRTMPFHMRDRLWKIWKAI